MTTVTCLGMLLAGGVNNKSLDGSLWRSHTIAHFLLQP